MNKHSLIRSALRTLEMTKNHRLNLSSNSESNTLENLGIILHRFSTESIEDCNVEDYTQLAGYYLMEYENHPDMKSKIAEALYAFASHCIECTAGTSENQIAWYNKYYNKDA